MDLADLWLIPLGVAVGAFGTIVGAGGGFVLVPVLLFLYPEEPPKALTAISLFVVCLNSISGSVAYARQKRIDFRSGGWFALATLPGAIGGAVVVQFVPRQLFDAIFATVLMAIGLFLLVRKRPTGVREPVQGRGVVRRMIRDRNGSTFVYSFRLWVGMVLSAGVGFLSSLLGIGGGVIHVPVMVTLLHFPVHIAASTSQFVLAFMAAEGTAVHFSTGTLGWNEELVKAALLAAGAIPGAQLGALVARRLKPGVIVRALSLSLMVVGLRLGLKALGY